MAIEIQFLPPSTIESYLQASVGFNYPSTRKKLSDSTLQGNHISTPLRNCDTISPLAMLGGSFLPQYISVGFVLDIAWYIFHMKGMVNMGS